MVDSRDGKGVQECPQSEGLFVVGNTLLDFAFGDSSPYRPYFIRSAVSRYYYAMVHATKSVMIDLQWLDEDKVFIHSRAPRTVIEQVNKLTKKVRRKTGKSLVEVSTEANLLMERLRDAKEHRNHADYGRRTADGYGMEAINEETASDIRITAERYLREIVRFAEIIHDLKSL